MNVSKRGTSNAWKRQHHICREFEIAKRIQTFVPAEVPRQSRFDVTHSNAETLIPIFRVFWRDSGIKTSSPVRALVMARYEPFWRFENEPNSISARCIKTSSGRRLVYLLHRAAGNVVTWFVLFFFFRVYIAYILQCARSRPSAKKHVI